MARKPEAKREVIGYRLFVLNPNFNQNGQAKWLSPEFSFRHKGEALDYRERHYPGVTKYRVQAVRARVSLDIPKDFFFKSQTTEGTKAST